MKPGLHPAWPGLLVAVLPFADFAQSGFTAFVTASLLGGLGASPEEFGSVTVAYAVVAVCAIAAQRLLVERFGWRRLLVASSLLSTAGLLLCAGAGGLPQFAAGRLLVAAGGAPGLTAARVLVLELFAPPRRFLGIRFLASGVAWGVAAGPLLGGAALQLESWRWGFALLLAAPLASGVLAVVNLPRAGGARRAAMPRDLLGLGLLALGSAALLGGLQQAGFDYFDQPRWLLLFLLLAAPPLAAFAWLQGRGAGLLQLRTLLQPRLAGGLGIFGACYLVLGASNMMQPLLLQRVLQVPPATAGFWLGAGSLAGVASWIVLARVLPRQPGPLRYYAFGLLALLASAWQLGGLSEASPPARVLPALALHGVAVIVVLSVTAMRAFQPMQHDTVALSHANQAKNMLAQFGLAAGALGATLLLQQRGALHYNRLLEGLAADRGAWDAALQALQGVLPPEVPAQAVLAQAFTQEALWLASLDYFLLVAWGAAALLAALGLLALARRSGAAAPRA